jgi:FkbM family methyltransferase
VRQKHGLYVLAWEIFCQVLKPLLKLYETTVWHWNRATGRLCFSVHGHQIAVFPGDPGISRELSIYRTHEPLTTQLVKEFLKPGMNVVDIGGNLGYYALLAAQSIGGKGRVIAIEPVASNFAQLSRNIEANGCHNVFLHNIAIGPSNGAACMYIGKKSNWHTLHPVPWQAKRITVPISTLDFLLKQHHLPSVDLVRMDLEGYEIKVIDGMLATIEKYSPRLLVELHPHLTGVKAMAAYLERLRRLGYELEWVVDNERDRPLRWWLLRPEKLSLQELMLDPWMTTDRRTVVVLLAREAKRRNAAPRTFGWTRTATVPGERSAVMG